jgi:hypothetical protein
MIHDVCVELNMKNISKSIPINIYRNPNIVENMLKKEDYYPYEIQIYSSLFKKFHDIFV